MSDGSWEQVCLVTRPQTNCTVIIPSFFLNLCFFVGVFIFISFSPLSHSNASITFKSFWKRQNYIYLFIYLLIHLLFFLFFIYLYFIYLFSHSITYRYVSIYYYFYLINIKYKHKITQSCQSASNRFISSIKLEQICQDSLDEYDLSQSFQW